MVAAEGMTEVVPGGPAEAYSASACRSRMCRSGLRRWAAVRPSWN